MDYAMPCAEASGAAGRPLRHIKPAAFSRGFTGL
jgi:hypothetical protein